MFKRSGGHSLPTNLEVKLARLLNLLRSSKGIFQPDWFVARIRSI